MRVLLTLATLVLASVPAAASALPKLPEIPKPVSGNLAERLADLPLEDQAYDPATGCKPSKRQPGTAQLVAWLRRPAGRTSFWADR